MGLVKRIIPCLDVESDAVEWAVKMETPGADEINPADQYGSGRDRVTGIPTVTQPE